MVEGSTAGPAVVLPWYQHPSGVECADVTDALNANLGYVLGNVWRYRAHDVVRAIWHWTRHRSHAADEPDCTKSFVAVIERFDKVIAAETRDDLRVVFVALRDYLVRGMRDEDALVMGQALKDLQTILSTQKDVVA